MILLLIRHASNDSIGSYVAGRRPGLHLNAEGVRQAEALAERLRPVPIAAVYSSPLERARETAEPISRDHGGTIGIDEAFIEIDYGEWTGRTMEQLEDDPSWRHWNEARSAARIPGGEMMIETQTRVVAAITRLCEKHPTERIAVVSHGDPIRSAIAYYAGIPIDLSTRIDIGLASVSVVSFEGNRPRILGVNRIG
jgi:probable phosphomutase (TIGR03848 family)